MYAPNITAGSQQQLIDNARRVVALGATAVMINAMQVGLDSLRVLTNAHIGVPIHVHRAGHDNYSRGHVGVNTTVLSKAFRLGGADLVHTGPVFGRLYDPEEIIRNVRSLTDDWYGLKHSLPVLSRSAARIVQDSIDYLATDNRIHDPANVMFLVDKDVYQYADATTGSIYAPTRSFVAAVKRVEVNTERSKTDILQKQGYPVGSHDENA